MPTNPLQELLIRRLAVVQEIARLNARQLHNRQLLCGCEMELVLAERGAGPGDEALLRAQIAMDEAVTRLGADDEELALWQARLDDIDRRIAATDAGNRGDPSVQ